MTSVMPIIAPTPDEAYKTMRRFKRIKIGIMRSPMFVEMSGIMMMGKDTISDTFPTAGTDGRNEIYGRALLEEFGDKEVGFVILHENMHKAHRHPVSYQNLYKKDPRRANAACDYYINGKLVKADPSQTLIAMPRRDGKVYGLWDAKYDGWTVKKIWDDLPATEKPKGGTGDGEEGEDGGDDKGKGKGGNGSGDHGGFDQHDWDEPREATKEEQEVLRREVEQAIRQGHMAAKKIGVGRGNFALDLEELLKPKLDWTELLREFIRSNCAAKDTSSWRRPNRRFLHQGIYLPTLIGEKVREIVYAQDTSGSITKEEHQLGITELVNVCRMVRPDKVHVIYWDTAVARHELYEGADIDDIYNRTKMQGGGGTDPRCVEEFLLKEKINPECIVVLTDGYVSSWGSKWNAPILWVICNNENTVAGTGKTIYLNT